MLYGKLSGHRSLSGCDIFPPTLFTLSNDLRTVSPEYDLYLLRLMASLSSSTRRRTASSAASRPHLIAEIKPLISSLEASVSDPDILVRLQWLSLLRRILIDSPEAKG